MVSTHKRVCPVCRRLLPRGAPCSAVCQGEILDAMREGREVRKSRFCLWCKTPYFPSVCDCGGCCSPTCEQLRDERRKRRTQADEGAHFLPTPEAIAAGCAEIRRTWDDAEYERRARWATSPAIEYGS